MFLLGVSRFIAYSYKIYYNLTMIIQNNYKIYCIQNLVLPQGLISIILAHLQQFSFKILMQKSIQSSSEEQTQQMPQQKMKCANGNQATKVCLSIGCHAHGLICHFHQCICLKMHENCQFTKVEFLNDKIAKKQALASLYKRIHESSIIQYQNVIDEIILKLRNMVDDLDQFKKQTCLSESQKAVLQISKSRNYGRITGNLLAGFIKDIHVPQMIKSKQFIQHFWANNKGTLDTILKSVKSNCFFKQHQNQITEQKNYLFNSNLIYSKKQSKLIKNWFYQQRKQVLVQTRLLYRASNHNFSIQKFYNKCGAERDTLIILKTQFDKVIGGFTPEKWISKPQKFSQFFRQDHSKSAFLFSLTQKQKYKCIKYTNSIAIVQTHNPVFGGLTISPLKPDLFIGNNSDKKASCISFFPQNYMKNQKRIFSNQQACLRFTGQKCGKQFKVKQWQVHQMIFQK